jgi:uncharacterized protein
MRIIVVSDTHGNYLAPLSFLEETGADLLIHLGDEIADAKALEQIIDTPVLKVPGNCDPGAKEPRELLASIAGKKFFITHGDLYRVKNGIDRLAEKAAAMNAAAVLFGHTHKPSIQKQDGILLINPGNLMAGSNSKSYAILTVTLSLLSDEIIYLP